MVFLRFASWLLLASCVSACSMFGGNSGSSADIGVYLDPGVQDAYGYCPSLEVDVIGVTEAEKKRLDAYSADRYFSSGDQLRRNLGAATIHFSEDDTDPKLLTTSSEPWQRWKEKGVDYVVVMVNLPYTAEEGDEKSADPRKLIIDLNDGWLMNSGTHNVTVGLGGIVKVEKPPKSREPVEIDG